MRGRGGGNTRNSGSGNDKRGENFRGDGNYRRRSGGQKRNDGLPKMTEEEEFEMLQRDSLAPTLNLIELQENSMVELTTMANEMGVEAVGAISKQNLVYEILKANAEKNGLMF
ncbi:MAG: Rho termination factor N-terminal domain-containing protein, partial [Lentisphaeria bacterium]|nr:Rho termination factor N-terminal domain-containing protein [Lentisphaeria bacterium]